MDGASAPSSALDIAAGPDDSVDDFGIVINVVHHQGGEDDGGDAMEGVTETGASGDPGHGDASEAAEDRAPRSSEGMPDAPIAVSAARRVAPGDEDSWLSFLNQPHIDFPVDVYDPNEIFDRIEQEGADAAVPTHIRKPRRLGELLLDLERPELTTRMVDFMLEDDAFEAFLDFLVRPNVDVRATMAAREGRPARERDRADHLAMRRSFVLMQLLTDNSRNANRFLVERIKPVVSKLMQVFEYFSDANFHHFRKIFETLMRLKPGEVMDVVMHGTSSENVPWLFCMIDLVDDSSVSQCLSTLFFAPVKLAYDREQRRKFYQYLREIGFLKVVTATIASPDPSMSLAAADYMVRLIDDCTRVDASEVIVNSCLHSPIGKSMVNWLLQGAVSADAGMGNAQRTGYARVMRALFAKSEPKVFEVTVNNTFSGAISQHIPNGLAGIHDIVQAIVLSGVPELTRLAVMPMRSAGSHDAGLPIQLPSHTLKAGFPSFRQEVLELLYSVLESLADPGPDLDKIDPMFWKYLTHCFFEYRFNNVYHNVFYKLFALVLRCNHVPSIKAIMKNGFVTRCIDHYLSPEPSGLRGHIALICNLLRLTAAAQAPQQYVPSMLQSHSQWIEFLPRLRSDTMQLAVNGLDVLMTNPTLTRPSPHVGPVNVLESDLPNLERRWPRSTDVELGSVYAAALGFSSATKQDDVGKPPTPAVGAIMGAGSPPDDKKKKKKKRKGKHKSKSGGDRRWRQVTATARIEFRAADGGASDGASAGDDDSADDGDEDDTAMTVDHVNGAAEAEAEGAPSSPRPASHAIASLLSLLPVPYVPPPTY